MPLNVKETNNYIFESSYNKMYVGNGGIKLCIIVYIAKMMHIIANWIKQVEKTLASVAL